MRLSFCLAALFPILAQCQKAPEPPAGVRKLAEIDYVGQGNQRQMLDLYLPEAKSPTPRPLVVFIHGGGWEHGSKDDVGGLFGLLKDTPFAGASLNYRLTDQATWPAQIHDCKAAIRWLRAHAAEHHLDPDRISVFGISAGGHLASLLGVTGGVAELEGTLGQHPDQSSRVTCVLDFCGPSNFLTFAGPGTIIDVNDPKTGISKLLGGTIHEKPELARQASPVTHITRDDAPFLIIHGSKDNIVRPAQAVEFDAALTQAGVPATLVTGKDGGHVFFSFPLVKRMRDFLDRHLLGKDVRIPAGAVPSE